MSNANSIAEQPAVDSGSPPAKRKRGPGAPLGNRNRSRHGVRGYLTIGSLPKGASYVRRLAGEFERGLWAAVQAKSGELSIYSAAVCQTAVRHEARAQLLTRWLRVASDGDKVSLLDRVAILREIGSASDARDNCLRKLGLDALPKSADPWATVFDPLPAPAAHNGHGSDSSAPGDTPADPAAPDATSGTSGDVAANGKAPDTIDPTEGNGRQ